MEGHQREAAGTGKVTSNQHNIFPIPCPKDPATARTISTLNHLFDLKTTLNTNPTTAQLKAATALHANINQPLMDSLEENHLINIINELGELVEDCATKPETCFVRGLFKDAFDPDRLALPPPKQSSYQHEDWTRYLSTEIKAAITTKIEENFTTPIIEGIESAKALPEPRCYCKPGKYARMLERMNHPGLLAWRLDEQRESKLSKYTSFLQITSFSITKSEAQDRLISWTRIANLFSKPPPPPDLPDPSLFEYLTCGQVRLGGIYLDVANMFHNLVVPKPMTDLFPLPPERFADLNSETQKTVLEQVGVVQLHPATLLRPAQATIPMGFTWAVTLAHDATTNIITEAFSRTIAARALDSNKRILKFFRKTDAPFHLVTGLALALEIIDDISIIFVDWPNEEIAAVHHELKKLLINAGLPIAADKSLETGKIEAGIIPFIVH